MYALGPIPPEDEIRESVLANRPHFEAKLAAGTRDLPMNRFVGPILASCAALK
jgi:hypothetical protein